jgi:hypothetical protein
VLDDRGFEARQGLGIFLFTNTVSRPALGPTQPAIQWVLGALTLGGSQECVELYLHSPIRLHGVVLSLQKHRDDFTFYEITFSLLERSSQFPNVAMFVFNV